MENIIAPYHKIGGELEKKIKHPSQEFMFKIKKLNTKQKTIFNLIEKKILKKFKNVLEEVIYQSGVIYKKHVFIVFPPTKINKINQIKLLIKLLKVKGDFKIIELRSEKYKLTKMNKSERTEYLQNNYKNWTILNGPTSYDVNNNSFFIFIDDILTTGSTSHFTMKAVENLFNLKTKPFYRSIYLMGTKSSSLFNAKKFYYPFIWENELVKECSDASLLEQLQNEPLTNFNDFQQIKKLDKVSHFIFGEGTVISVSRDRIKICFKSPYGTKTIVKNHKFIKMMK